MHPRRIPAMLELLADLAVDPEEPVGPDNPLRQVIVNTHSPSVVAEVNDDALLVAEVTPEGRRDWRLRLSFLPDTWRSRVSKDTPPVARGVLQDYLNPLGRTSDPEPPRPGVRRVKDRPDLQMLLPYPEPAAAAEE